MHVVDEYKITCRFSDQATCLEDCDPSVMFICTMYIEKQLCIGVLSLNEIISILEVFTQS